jgi:hypothetical protein
LKSFTTQVLMILAAVFFLMKGGFGILAAAWKLVLPVAMLGASYYFIRKALAGSALPRGAGVDNRRMNDAQPTSGPANYTENNVIEICPHCLSEVGSCPKCRKKKFF